MASSLAAHGSQARRLAGVPLSRRDADGHRDGILREGDRQRRCPGAVRAADHFQRWQLRIAGVDTRHSRARARGAAAPRSGGVSFAGNCSRDSRSASFSVRSDSLRIAIWSAFSHLYGPHWLLVALTVAFALIGVVLWGSIVGSMLPFVLRRLGFDPATSSAPFVATLVDVTGLIIYFSVGLVILRGTLL